jgi:MYXO-CTERM domain-containing protein
MAPAPALSPKLLAAALAMLAGIAALALRRRV